MKNETTILNIIYLVAVAFILFTCSVYYGMMIYRCDQKCNKLEARLEIMEHYISGTGSEIRNSAEAGK